ncbi:hypothetical protein HOF92_16050 [bacterium]|jgi:hypothetical protein|nr:hypothetical protein [bacterium]
MGLLDRLKKKPSTPEEKASIPDLDDETQSIKLDSESSGGADEIAAAPSQKSSRSWIGIVLALIVLVGSGGGLFYYWKTYSFKQAKKIAIKFFTILSKGETNRAYALMADSYRDEVRDKEFAKLIDASSFLFDDIIPAKIKPRRTLFEETATGSKLGGALSYADGSSGKFEIWLKENEDSQNPRAVSRFEVHASERKKRVYDSASKAITEFFKTLKEARLEQFIDFLHPSIQERLGRVKMAQLHNNLIEMDFVNHQFDPQAYVVKRNVELHFSGSSTTQKKRIYRGSITVFYSKRRWYILSFDFEPRA